MTNAEIVRILTNVSGALELLKIDGSSNWQIVLASINDLKCVRKEMERRIGTDGNANPES
ncbi:MAG: hypothetical protein VB049_11750 [Candidatus Pelethousia sp.]|nr:hypothetical protein [Candidatus Pelethousia sp.]